MIHKVSGEGAVCPVNHDGSKKAADEHTNAEVVSKLDKDLAALDKEFDEINVPSLKQYRKLKRVMASITGFYLNGTKKKLENYETMVQNLKTLDTDLAAVQAQLAALEARSEFTGHPKVAQYREFLLGEQQTFLKKKESMEAKKKVGATKNPIEKMFFGLTKLFFLQEFHELHVWSGVINEVCRWLEDNLDAYALEVIPDLKIQARPVQQLTPEQIKIYSKVLFFFFCLCF